MDDEPGLGPETEPDEEEDEEAGVSWTDLALIGFVAGMLLPAFAGAGKAVEYVDENVLHRADTNDIHFPRFP